MRRGEYEKRYGGVGATGGGGFKGGKGFEGESWGVDRSVGSDDGSL